MQQSTLEHTELCFTKAPGGMPWHVLTCRDNVQEPEASLEGLGGTYFFMDEAGKRSAIVKPCDEEPLAPCNPKVPVRHTLLSWCCWRAPARLISGMPLGRPITKGQLGQVVEPLKHAMLRY